MTTKVAAVVFIALLAGISDVPASPGAAATPGQSFCDQARDFVRRHGRARAIEIAKLRHSDAEIEAWRRACFPDSRPINRLRTR